MTGSRLFLVATGRTVPFGYQFRPASSGFERPCNLTVLRNGRLRCSPAAADRDVSLMRRVSDEWKSPSTDLLHSSDKGASSGGNRARADELVPRGPLGSRSETV